MNIDESQLKDKPKHIGTLHGHKVFRVVTKGGFVIVAKGDGEVLASSPHAAISSHIAQKKNPDLHLLELSKSEWVDPDSDIVQKYTDFTDQILKAQSE